MTSEDTSRLDVENENEELRARIKALEASLEIEGRWKFALDVSGDGFWDLDFERQAGFYSANLKKMLGYAEDDPTFSGIEVWKRLVHPLDYERVERAIISHQQGKSDIYADEFRMRCKNGSYRWILSRGKVVRRADDGKPLRSIGTHTDITTQKNIEESLRESEERLRLITDNMTDMISLHKADGSTLFVTPSMFHLTGLSEQDVLSQDPMNWVHSEDARKIVQPAFEQATRERKIVTVSYRARRKDGSFMWVESTLHPITDQHGELAYLQSVTRDISERKSAEEMFRKAFDASPALMIITSVDEGHVIDLNQALMRTLNITKEEFIARYESDRIHPEEIKLRAAILNLLDKHGSFSNLEGAMYTSSGRKIEGLVSGETIQLAGRPHHMISLVDITERKHIEQALRESEEQLRESQKLAKLGSWEFDAATNKTTCSKELENILEIAPDESGDLAEIFSERLHPQERGQILSSIAAAKQSTDPSTMIHRLLMPDGRVKYVRHWAKAIETSDGASFRWMGSMQDITDWATTQQQLTESQTELEIFKTLINDSMEAISIRTADQHYLYTNPAHKRLFGYSGDQPGSLVFREFFTPESQETLDRIVFPELEAKGSWAGILHVHSAEGRVIPLWEHIGVIRDESGKIQYNFSIMHDDSQRIQAEIDLRNARDQAEAASQAKSEFLRMVSHEIRTPMNSILGFTRLLDENLNDPRLKGYLAPIQTSGNTLILLINDILDLSRMEAGKLSLQLRPVLLRHVFAEIEEMFALRTIDKGISLITTIDPSIPGELELDETRTRQVLFNLVGNAIKFTDKGHVILSARAQNLTLSRCDLIISIEDSGPGISEEQIPHIFEEFGVKTGRERSPMDSTGLGLAISKRLVTLMSGDITIKSEEGRGSLFEVRLPNITIPPSARPGFAALLKPDNEPGGVQTPELPDFQNVRAGRRLATEPVQTQRSLPRALRTILETSFLPRWEQFSELQPVDSMRRFGEELAILGEQHANLRVSHYAARLLGALDLFDIEEIDRLLGEFPDLLLPTRRSQAAPGQAETNHSPARQETKKRKSS